MAKKEVLNRPAGDGMETCPKCKREHLHYNPYHHWVNCHSCGYRKLNVYR